MGKEAMFDIISVATSSLGCISLICLLPIILMAKITNTYNIIVLIIEINIISPRISFAKF